MMETWVDIKGFVGLYQVSDQGNVRSLSREVDCGLGRRRTHKGQNLVASDDGSGYLKVMAYSKGVPYNKRVAQLVGEAFLGYKPNRVTSVVNHINHNKADNRLVNIEVVSQRVNANLKHKKSSSKHVGVSWYKDRRRWGAGIMINGKHIHLGFFINETDAAASYKDKLDSLTN